MGKDSAEDQPIIVEKLPFVNELIQRIASVNQSIERGETGHEEIMNLITDIPESWLKSIQDKIEKVHTEHELAIKNTWDKRRQGATPNQRDVELIRIKKDETRELKQLIISMLDKKGMLFFTRAKVEERNLDEPEEEI